MEKISTKAKNYLRGHIRNAWRYYSVFRQGIKRDTKNCPVCAIKLTPKAVKVDHIKQVGKFTPEDNPYIMAMFTDKSNLQGLCRPCHAVKTKAEAKLRRKK